MRKPKHRQNLIGEKRVLQKVAGVSTAAFLFVTTAQARIGETEAEITARCGDPVLVLPSTAEPGRTKCYLSGGFSIAVTYIHDRSVREIVAKADKSKITDIELHRLLEANAGGSPWNMLQFADQKDAPPDLLEWTNERYARVAFYDSRTQAFFVTTKRFIDVTNANRRSTDRAKSDRVAGSGSGARELRDFRTGSASAAALLGGGHPSQQPAASPPASK